MIDGNKLLKGLMQGSLGGSTRKSLAGGGGLLMLGGIAYAAYEHFSQNRQAEPNKPPQAAPPPPPGMVSAPPPPPPAMGHFPVAPIPTQYTPAVGEPPIDNEKALTLVRAMIAAAKADGVIDETERAKILKALDEQDQGGEAHAFIEAEIAKPLNLFEITSSVKDEATAFEVYTASCMAIEIDTDQERQYLDRLAARLGIEPEQASAIERQVAAPQTGQA